MNTPIKYIDFIPQLKDKSFWGGSTYESIDEVLERANQWTSKHYNKTVINIETVMLTNIYQKDEATTNEVYQLHMVAETLQYFQVIRIWYRD